MNEFKGKERRRSSDRQLEEVLQDPNAKWSDIRKAIKAQARAACTNAALMRAIAGGMSSSQAMYTLDAVPTAASPMVQSLTSTNECSEENKARAKSENGQYHCLGNGYSEYFVPTHQEPPTLTDPIDANKPTKHPPRRSSAFLDRSINSMDFGVDHFLELEEESSKYKRSESFVSNYTCDSDGFMGWKYDNDVSSSKSETTNLSSYCDHDGFLSWEQSSNLAAAETSTAGTIASVMIGLGVKTEDTQEMNESPSIEHYGATHGNVPTKASDDVKGPINFFSFIARRSATASAEIDANSIGGSDLDSEESQPQRKSWHIEDYEGFNDSVPTLASTDSKSSMTFLSFVSRRKLSAESRLPESAAKESGLVRKAPLWKKIISVSKTKSCEGLRSSSPSETFELNDVRQALLNVRKNSSYARTKTENHTPVINQSQGVSNAKPKYSTEDVSKQIQPLRSTNSLSSISKQEGKCFGFMSFQRSNDEKQPRSTPKMSHVTFSSATNHDTREAIWIKQTDGGVDIKKECRKLYLGAPVQSTDSND
ncbi:hypothetical protein HJC23_004355 [Cyclotella cryptica]|uniref:Uncharacterized protein n=1 Tax=Cyclotella cryptica TaxID=29204 RepID=A0ABD3NXL0_9STRA|eukprot:CCRYP_019096-RA/>CCRYP_019096-RA protein AED:0.08 eAED:0.08 QI:0/-1/0/1/-1/1/1/0/537